MLDGRVKTLHPKVHGGILHRRENAAHRAAVAEHEIPAIDMVVVKLYAFEKTAAKPGAHFEEIIENIDIGGPSMTRSAAKNFQDVAVVTSPPITRRLPRRWRGLGPRFRRKPNGGWRKKAFATTAAYDSAIASTLERISAAGGYELAPRTNFPETLRLSFRKQMDLRYGENPHQKAAMYADDSGSGVAHAKQVQGKELSYNNIVDLQAAWDLAREFDEPSVRRSSSTPILAGRRRARRWPRPLRVRAGVRSSIGVRRSDRSESAGGCGGSGGNGEAVSGGDRRALVRTGGERCFWLEEELKAGRGSESPS